MTRFPPRCHIGGAAGGGPASGGAPGPCAPLRRNARTAQITPPAAAAPISAQAQPGSPFDSEDCDAFAAAAPTAAAGAWLVEVVVVAGAGVVTV
jgi:hypothetical protein